MAFFAGDGRNLCPATRLVTCGDAVALAHRAAAPFRAKGSPSAAVHGWLLAARDVARLTGSRVEALGRVVALLRGPRLYLDGAVGLLHLLACVLRLLEEGLLLAVVLVHGWLCLHVLGLLLLRFVCLDRVAHDLDHRLWLHRLTHRRLSHGLLHGLSHRLLHGLSHRLLHGLSHRLSHRLLHRLSHRRFTTSLFS